ncbi:MAG TPA: glycosyltransferase [Actinomycetota bacterium]|jgi:glycosyltransferase involved in cell wall biosynthesis|nr:glycosyltransferase [Actinomycetota bacterium]
MRSPFGRARRAVSERLTAPRAIERVASLGPSPPAPTGIATYHRAVLDGLARIGFTERMPVDPIWPVRDADFATVPAYRLGIYHLGNNADFHLPIYRMVWQAPGLIVLHDLSLDDFVRGLMTSGDKLGFVAMREALEARERMSLPEALANKPLRIPWIAAVARRARGIVVHADFCRRYLEDMGCRTPVFVIPHPPVESAQALAAAGPAGRRLRESTDAGTLVVAPGDINEAKQLGALLAAVKTLPDDVHVAIVGRTVETYDFEPIARAAALGDRLHLERDVTDDAFLAWLAAADIVVDLRNPHRGEVSGSLARAMQVGRPAIVSATGTYLDSPDGTVLTVAPGETDPEELAARIGELAADPERGERMGATARAYMADLAAREATAYGYADAIDATMRVVDDPVGPNMRRWADALADLGVTEPELAEGYGLAFARALESFTHPS